MTLRCRHLFELFARRVTATVALLLSAMPLSAQGEGQYILSEDGEILAEHIIAFMEETTELMDYIGDAQQAQISSIHRFANIINTRWKGFLQLEQEAISQDDSLMVLVSDFEQSMKMVTDSIAAREQKLQMHANFVNAEKFLSQQQQVYDRLLHKANMLAQTSQTATQLEQHKTHEQIIFANVQQHYNNAKEAALHDAKLQKRMEKIEQAYVKIKTDSETIQAAQYKPFIERAKDYLISAACVTILLMFITMLQARLKAIKQARKAANDMKKLIEKQHNDIPTI